MTSENLSKITDSAYQTFLTEEKIAGSHCPNCNKSFLPPRAICPSCNGNDMQWDFFDGDGKLATYTFVNIVNSTMASEGYGRDNPNCSGIVELEKGVRIAAQIVGLDDNNKEEVAIGMPLKVKFLHQEKNDRQVTLLAFQPK